MPTRPPDPQQQWDQEDQADDPEMPLFPRDSKAGTNGHASNGTPAPQANGDGAPINYWLHPCKLTVTVHGCGKVHVDWEPKTQALTLSGPFGHAVWSPFERIDGVTLQSAVQAEAIRLALSGTGAERAAKSRTGRHARRRWVASLRRQHY